MRRWRAFDDPGASGETSAEVFGHEEVQQRIHEILSEFARHGRCDRFILLHGPNGSAKSSLIDALVRALERYSATPEGALYRFSWIFCESGDRERLGFQPGKVLEDDGEPRRRRRAARLVARAERAQGPAVLPDPEGAPPGVLRGLLKDAPAEQREAVPVDRVPPARRSLAEVEADLRLPAQGLRRRLEAGRQARPRRALVRVAAATAPARSAIEPQATIDAQSRMLAHGEPERASARAPARDARRGFRRSRRRERRAWWSSATSSSGRSRRRSTCSRRPSAPLSTSPGYTAQLNLVMFGTTNEQYLASFKRDPSFASFKGRFELVRVPYLLEYKKEAQIYARHLGHLRGEPARRAAHGDRDRALGGAHAAQAPEPGPLSGRRAVRRPAADAAPQGAPLRPVRASGGPDRGGAEAPAGRDQEPALASTTARRRRSKGAIDAAYEGRGGASPREILALLADVAIQSARPCISPVDIFEALPVLISDRTVHHFLRVPKDGAFHDPETFVDEVRGEYVTKLAVEIQRASDVVDEAEYGRLFQEYFRHVKAFDTQQRVQNKETGKLEPPGREPDGGGRAALRPEGVAGAVPARPDHAHRGVPPRQPREAAGLRRAVRAPVHGAAAGRVRGAASEARAARGGRPAGRGESRRPPAARSA